MRTYAYTNTQQGVNALRKKKKNSAQLGASTHTRKCSVCCATHACGWSPQLNSARPERGQRSARHSSSTHVELGDGLLGQESARERRDANVRVQLRQLLHARGRAGDTDAAGPNVVLHDECAARVGRQYSSQSTLKSSNAMQCVRHLRRGTPTFVPTSIHVAGSGSNSVTLRGPARMRHFAAAGIIVSDLCADVRASAAAQMDRTRSAAAPPSAAASPISTPRPRSPTIKTSSATRRPIASVPNTYETTQQQLIHFAH